MHFNSILICYKITYGAVMKTTPFHPKNRVISA